MPTLPTRCTAQPLAAEQIDQAFPLVRLLAPTLSLEHWRRYARAMTQPHSAAAGRGGIVVLADAAGYLFGLFSYVDRLDLLHGPTLQVDNLVIPHLLECRQATQVLEREMRDIARRFDCRGIRVRLARPAEPEGGVARFLATSGYRAEGTTWCRTLPATPENAARGRHALRV